MVAAETPKVAAHAPPPERHEQSLAVLAGAVDRIASGFPTEAVDALQQLCAEHPDWAVARAYYGTALLGAHRVVEARETLEDAIALAPESFICHMRYGEYLARTGFYDRAAHELEIALHLPAPDTGARDAAAMLRSFCRQRARGMFYRETPNLRSRLQPLLSRFQRRSVADAETER
jgi:predicted Zn-dependent protease